MLQRTMDARRTRNFAAAGLLRREEWANAGEDGQPAAGLGIAHAACSHATGGGRVGLALFARGVGCRRVRPWQKMDVRSWRKTDRGGDLTQPTAAEDGRSATAKIVHSRPRAAAEIVSVRPRRKMADWS